MKNKKIICLFSILLCLTLMFGTLGLAVSALDARTERVENELLELELNADRFGQFLSYADQSQISRIRLEPTIYSTATLDQDFCGSSILVVIDRNISRVNRVFEESFFGSLAITTIEDLSVVVNEELLTASDYRALPSVVGWSANYINTNDAESVECHCTNCISRLRTADELPENWSIDRANFRQILQINLPIDCRENVLSTIAELEQIDGVLSAEPNYLGQIVRTPNDPRFSQQWALQANRMNAPGAWSIERGSSRIRVGVMDTGVDVHLDLMSNVCRLLAYDFIANRPILTSDPNGHGTHVAGIIGASGDNHFGITGVAWNVSLIPLRIADQFGFSITSANVVRAIEHARNRGVHILNASFTVGHSNALEQAVRNFPGLLVAAAGNDNRNNDNSPVFPANFSNLSNVITVGASTANDTRASFSNYSRSRVHLFAPGDNILSTVPITDDGDLDLGPPFGVIPLGISHISGFAMASGTSMAAPQVAGVAALMLSINPNLTPSEIRTIILNNVDRATAFNNSVSGGRLNAQRAVAAVPRPPSSGC